MPFSGLGPKQYGTKDWLTFSAYGFQGGLNIKSVPQEIDDGDLSQAINVRLRSDGGIEQRNGYSNTGGPLTLTSPGPSPTYGGVRFNQLLYNTGAVSNKYLLQQYNLNRLINSSTGTEAAGAPNPAFTSVSNVLTPWTTAVINDPVVNVTNGGTQLATDVLIIACGGDGPYYYDGTHAPYAPNGSTGGIGIASASAAQGATLVQVVNNIVFFSGCANNPNVVFATSLYVAAVAGTGPEYYYQSFRMTNPVTSLGIIGSGAQASLVVGTQKTLTLIYGTYPGNYNVQDIPVADGPISARCNVSVYGQYFYLGRQAFYRFDGQSAPQRLSDKIEPWILGVTNAAYPNLSMQGDRTKYWAYYFNNRVSIVYDSSGTGSLNTQLVFDLINNGWTPYTTPDPFVGFAALDGPGDPAPTVGVIFNQNSGAQWFWDSLSTGYSTADQYTGSGPGTPIAAQFLTKYFKVGVPGTPKKIMNWYPEFFSAGTLNISLNVNNDYGTNTSTASSFTPSPAGLFFYDGSALYDGASSPITTWGAGIPSFYGAPQTRTDILITYTDSNGTTFTQSGLQGEAFAFGANSTNTSAAWVFQGLTGTFAQEARV